MVSLLKIKGTATSGGTAIMRTGTFQLGNIASATDGGMLVAFCLNIANNQTGKAIEQSIKFAMSGKSMDGYSWGMELNLTFYNGGENPIYLTPPAVPPTSGCERLNGSDATQNTYARDTSWLMPSYDWLWSSDPNINPNPERKKQAICKLNGFTKRVVDQLGTEIIRKHYMWTGTSDPSFLPAGETYVPFNLEILDNQAYFFSIYLSDIGDSFFSINGFEKSAHFTQNDHDIDNFPLPEIAVGDDEQKVYVGIAAPMVNDKVTFTLGNIWMGLVNVTHDEIRRFIQFFYDRKTGEFKLPPISGLIPISDAKILAPNFFFDGRKGLNNNINNSEILIEHTGTSHEMISGDAVNTNTPYPFDYQTHQCIRKKVKPEPDTSYYFTPSLGGVEPTARFACTKTLVYELDSSLDWSKLFFVGSFQGIVDFAVMHKPSADVNTHMIFRYSVAAGIQPVDTDNIYYKTSLTKAGVSTAQYYDPNQGSSVMIRSPIARAYAFVGYVALISGFLDTDSFETFKVTDNLGNFVNKQGAPPATAFPALDPLPDYGIGTHLIIRTFARNSLDSPTLHRKSSTALINFMLFSKTTMDLNQTYNAVAWNDPYFTTYGYFALEHEKRFFTNAGADGSRVFDTKPDFYFTPKNGLGLFVNAASGKLCHSTPYSGAVKYPSSQCARLAIRSSGSIRLNLMKGMSNGGDYETLY